MIRLNRTAAAVAVGVATIACRPPAPDAAAEADHTHAGGGVVTLWTDSLELFVEYPPHVRGAPSDPWAIHLTWLADWSPVSEGSLTLVFRGPGGAHEEIEIDAPARPGVFSPTPALTATGTWRVDMVLAARGREFAIPVGQLQVFESEDVLPHEEDEAAPPDLIPFLKEQQWAMPFEVAVAGQREISVSIRATGEVVVPPTALAQISAPVSGLVLARGPAPGPGDPVRAGQTLALLAPTSVDDSYARLRADVERLERELARAERLFAVEAIAEKRVEETRHALEIAQAALASVGGAAGGGETGGPDAYTYSLTSPISGVVAQRHVTPGERIAVGAPAFTVVNPGTMWLLAHVPARDAASAAEVTGGWLTVEGGSRVYRADRVVAVGSVIDPVTRTLPIHLAVSNPDESLKVGMLAEGRLFVGAPLTGVAIPAIAIQEEDGLSVAYVKLGGEAFQRRVLTLGPSDGMWTIVRSGIGAGEQVVTIGAYQVKLASLGDAEISDHGHPH
jgi:RND family efflux transporter MFP subunit